MIIAITGATGFIGSLLVEKHIELGDTVRILTRQNKEKLNLSNEVNIFHGNITKDTNVLSEFVKDVDILYHCAAEINNPKLMKEVNVVGTQNLISAAKGEVKRWVQLSSTGVYGNPLKGVIDENSIENPQNNYEVTKLEADKLVIDAGSKNWFEYTILRPSNVFGANMRNQSLFQLIKSIDKEKYYHIGRKWASANYISVENVIDALYKCGKDEKAKNEMFILSDWCTMKDFTEHIAKLLGKEIPQLRLPKLPLKILTRIISILLPNFPIKPSRINALTSQCSYSINHIVDKLNYEPIVPIKEDLNQLVKKYKSKL